MSTFYVGQRVRVVRSRMFPEFVGRECVITEGPCIYYSRTLDCLYEGYTTSLHPQFGPRSDALEPIVDDGRQVISWADMADLWTPEQVTA
jgi:hypothetical protein